MRMCPCQKLELSLVVPSLGGVESLVTRPATTSHVGLTPSSGRRIGINDGLVRVSTGIEARRTWCRTFLQALDAAAAAASPAS